MDVEDAFRSHHQALFRFLARESGDPELAQDAVQETFLRLHRRPPDDVAAVRPWLFVTGLNVIRDATKIASNRRRLLERRRSEYPRPSRDPTPEERLELAEDHARLREALDGLRERERVALLMREEGFKHREIAEALDTTTGSIGTLIARSLDKLARALDALEES
jgi:RNA polymerase sigma-70 factor (ECF subfamily)